MISLSNSWCASHSAVARGQHSRLSSFYPALLLLSACGSVPEMVVPDALAGSAESYEVSGANGTFLPSVFVQHVSFGPYRARSRVGVDVGTQTSATLFNGDIERKSDSQSG